MGSPKLVLPLGIAPFDIRPHAADSFEVIDRSLTHILLRVQSDTVVFYRGNPTLEFVFDTREVRKKITDKYAKIVELIVMDAFPLTLEDHMLPTQVPGTNWTWPAM